MHLVTSAVAKSMLAGDTLQRFIFMPGINRRPDLCPPGMGPTRFARKGYYKGCRGLEGNHLRSKAGARRADALGQLDARSVPHAADLQTWGVSLVAQTGW